jgi:hypothetical protein
MLISIVTADVAVAEHLEHLIEDYQDGFKFATAAMLGHKLTISRSRETYDRCAQECSIRSSSPEIYTERTNRLIDSANLVLRAHREYRSLLNDIDSWVDQRVLLAGALYSELMSSAPCLINIHNNFIVGINAFNRHLQEAKASCRRSQAQFVAFAEDQ